jgi:hypothetical protein
MEKSHSQLGMSTRNLETYCFNVWKINKIKQDKISYVCGSKNIKTAGNKWNDNVNMIFTFYKM